MKFLANKITRIIIVAVFTALMFFSIFLINAVEINYDMTKYLPANSNTKSSLEAMQDEFGNNSMIQMMVKDVSIIEANMLVEEINKIETVKSVVWLGIVDDISKPIEQMDQAMIKEFYHDDSFLFTIEFDFDDYGVKKNDKDNYLSDINLLREIAENSGIKAHLRGQGVTNLSSRDKVDNEMFWIFIVAVPIAVLILFLASRSWFEPVIVLINLGVAILINMGTNFLQGSVSYITIAITSVLQMAMSLDFSLFLVHRYYEERETKDKIPAVIQSSKDALKSVTASALTTIFGFLALTIMQYRIGFDIGIALAKAILISYLVTMFLLPVLIIILDKPLIKLKRKKRQGNHKGVTRFLAKYKIIISVVLVVFGGYMFYKQTQTNYLYGELALEDVKDANYQDELAIREVFGPFQPVVVLYNNDDKQEAIHLANMLFEIPEVRQIQSLITSIDPTLPEDILPPEAKAQFEGENYSRMIIYLDITTENERMFELSEIITELVLESLSSDSYLLGMPVSIEEIKTSVNADGIFVQLLSAIIIGLVIGIIFKSPIIPLVLVVLIEISIWTNIAFSVFTGGTLVYIGYLVVSSLQLGATIDYAVLLTSRYQEFRETLSPKEAIIEASSKSTPTIIVSALVLSSAGFVVWLISKLGIVKEIGMLIGRGALISGALVLFILPALLLTFDKLIQKSIIRRRKKIKNENNQENNIN